VNRADRGGSPAVVDPRLLVALTTQLVSREAALRAGAEHVGWKLGVGKRERIGDDIAVGHLTSATVVRPGDGCSVGGEPDLRADVELAVQLRVRPRGDDPDSIMASIAGTCVAVEIVDVSGDDDAATIVANNVFHRGVAFGPLNPNLPAGGVATLAVNGRPAARAGLAQDIPQRVDSAGRILATAGQPLRPGDRIITGSLAQVMIQRGDEITAAIDTLGSVRLTVTPPE
jgi:2-keto-4-pentenoate hydratase